MKLFSKIVAGLALAAALCASASATVVQTAGPGSFDSYSSWNQGELARITLATGTNVIDSLSTSATLWDQGWSGVCPSCNGVYLGLFQNDVEYYGLHTGGAIHEPMTNTYDFTAQDLMDINSALAGLDYSAGDISLRFMAQPVGWGAWELHVRDAYVTAASDTIPEPTSVALMGLGLGALALRRRKQAGVGV